MNTKCYRWMAVGLWMMMWGTPVRAQEQTIGLFLNDDRAFEGYTLITPLWHPSTYLINNEGLVVHAWTHEFQPGSAVYLLENGHLLRGARSPNPTFNFGGIGGKVREIAWDDAVVWDFTYSDDRRALHHDVARLPNGNVLMIAWEMKSAEEAIAAGRDPGFLSDDALWPEHIIEVRPTPPEGGEIVWEWYVWDHLIQDFDPTKANYGVVEDHPELIDLNYGPTPIADWLHFNAINYNPVLDQIILSVPRFGELWVIDHSTTTEEAAGHTGGRAGQGGDLLYRWGNPAAYRAGDASDKKLFFQHDTQWIETGLPGSDHVLIFNNGTTRPGDTPFSTIHELALPVLPDGTYARTPDGAFAPPTPVWQYEQPEEFYSDFASGVQRLANGNTLIAETANGRVFEVTPEGEKVWEYVSPVVLEGPLRQGALIPQGPTPVPTRLANGLFRAYRYGLDYPGLRGRTLEPQGLVELPANIEEGETPIKAELHQNYPNPFSTTTAISFQLRQPDHVTLTLFDLLGKRITTLTDRFYSLGTHIVHFDAADLPGGVYLYRLEVGERGSTRAMILAK